MDVAYKEEEEIKLENYDKQINIMRYHWKIEDLKVNNIVVNTKNTDIVDDMQQEKEDKEKEIKENTQILETLMMEKQQKEIELKEK